MERYTVGVVFGSRSTEHEVSIVSGLQTMQFLSGRHDVIPIYITKDGHWLTGTKLTELQTYQKLELFEKDLQTITLAADTKLGCLLNPLPRGLFGKTAQLHLDIIFPVVHGLHGEDGTLQGVLDLADMPYVGSGVLGSAIAIDKITTKSVLRQNDLPVIDWHWFVRSAWEEDSERLLAEVIDRLSLPVIVKPSRLGSTIGIQKASTVQELAQAIDVAVHYDSRILVEPYLANRMEINCAVLGNNEVIASACEQPISRDALLSYGDKYLHSERTRGMEGASRIIPAPIPTELTGQIQSLAKDAFKAIGALGTARVDFLIDSTSNRVYINEINTMPGSLGFYLWEPLGISPQALVDRLLSLGMEAYRDRRRSTYTFASPILSSTDLSKLGKR